MTPTDRPVALIVSLKFHPGHFSHLVANYRLLEEAGFTPVLYLHPRFARMDERREFRTVTSPRELEALAPRLAVFWFPNLRNVTEILRLRLRWRTRIVYVFHEPFETFARYRRRGFSPMRIAKIWLINLVNVAVLALSHEVILPSGSAWRRYDEAYSWLGLPASLVPLLFDDEAGQDIPVEVKEYIAYVGTIAPDHAFERFVAFAQQALAEGWFPGHRFAIATGSTLAAPTRAMLQPLVESGELVLVDGRPLTTTEINAFYRTSAIIWNAYHGSMQSGVLPKAFMFGTPVISRAGNANEYVTDGVTGVLVHDTADTGALRGAVQRVLDHQAAFTSACRAVFLDTFFYRNYARVFDRVAAPYRS